MRQTIRLAGLMALAVLSASPALAHHAMGGETPSTLVHGLLSGLGHPVIGLDHLAFIVALGLASAFTPNRYLPPLAFVAATVVGCLLLVGGVALPLIEIVVTASVVLVGGMVLSGRTFALSLYLVVFAIAGLFHGSAYGGSIVGAETTPLLAYLVGFAAIQYGIAITGSWLVTAVAHATDPRSITPRLAGAVTAGVGLAFLVENVEAALFG